MTTQSSRHPVFLFVLLALLPWPGQADADQVLLKNGDRLSGVIVGQDDETVRIETPYAGTVAVQREEVASTVVAGGDPADGTAEAPQSKPPRDKSRKGHVTVAASYSTGNTRTNSVYAEAAFTKREAGRRYGLGGKGKRTSEDGTTTTSNILVEAHHDWFLNGSDFWYVRGSAERDPFKDIESRFTMGAGYGLQVFDSTRTQLDVRAGPDLVSVNHDEEADENYPALGWGVNFTHWLVPDRVEAFHNQDGFWNLDDTGQVSLRTRTGLRMPIVKRLSANLQLNLDWESEPSPGRKSTDTTWLLGIGYEL
jgi:putative salt-induced outer membrane protein YdiY